MFEMIDGGEYTNDDVGKELGASRLRHADDDGGGRASLTPMQVTAGEDDDDDEEEESVHVTCSTPRPVEDCKVVQEPCSTVLNRGAAPASGRPHTKPSQPR